MPEKIIRDSPIKFKKVVKHYLCDDCNTPIEFDGMVLTSNPPQYPHTCPKCKKQYRFFDMWYPSEVLQEIEE